MRLIRIPVSDISGAVPTAERYVAFVISKDNDKVYASRALIAKTLCSGKLCAAGVVGSRANAIEIAIDEQIVEKDLALGTPTVSWENREQLEALSEFLRFYASSQDDVASCVVVADGPLDDRVANEVTNYE